MKRQRRPHKDALSDLRSVLSTAPGRRVLWSLLERCGIYGACFRGDGEAWTSYREGRRSIGIEMIPEMESAVPGVYAAMGREHADRTALAKLEAEKRLADQEADDEG